LPKQHGIIKVNSDNPVVGYGEEVMLDFRRYITHPFFTKKRLRLGIVTFVGKCPRNAPTGTRPRPVTSLPMVIY